MDDEMIALFEQQRLELLDYKDQLSKSMRPDEAEAKGFHLAATIGKLNSLGRE